MVAVERTDRRFSEVEYLALEGVAETKHEYLAGDIIGMAGAEPDHNQIVQNARAELTDAMRKSPCRISGADQRVKVEAKTEYFYPDVVVTCLEPQYVGPSPRSLVNPQIIIEVLSPTTELRDRGAKWVAYQTIHALTDYVMIASDSRRLEHYQRGADGKWAFQTLTEGACVLASGVRLDMSELYALTDL